MQQSVGIARAFSVAPDVLLMDEPFSHLDAITARSLREELQVMWNATKKTVLFVTHDVMEAVQLSNRIITLAHEGTVFDDTTVELPFPRKSSGSSRTWTRLRANHQAGFTGRNVSARWTTPDRIAITDRIRALMGSSQPAEMSPRSSRYRSDPTKP